MSAADLDSHLKGIRAGDRAALARAITLIESGLPADRELARDLVAAIMPDTGGAHRIGITGAPGAGKSTFIEGLGKHLTAAGHRVAVLAIDPTSERTGGSILGDKTRMQELARDPSAFIRPTPSGGALGGVARHTREAMLLCEAAGHDVVLVETVGVGQSEVVVANMVDTFVVLMLAGGGDELQGIKRGLLELTDVLAVTKADGDNLERARRAKADYSHALRLMEPRSNAWRPVVLTCSALTGEGVPEVWAQLVAHREAIVAASEWDGRRREQRLHWMWQSLEDGIRDLLRDPAVVGDRLQEIEQSVLDGSIAPDHGAAVLLAEFLKRSRAG